MPKQTFLNLPEEKRRRILDIAMEEFAAHKYSKASLSNIVSRAGIAKGSMYQYFEDKKDLFVYLLKLAAQEEIAYINQAVDPRADFFEAMEQSIIASLRFMGDHPKMTRLVANAMQPSGDKALEELYDKGRKMSLEFFETYLIKGQREGIIRSDADIHFVAYMISAMMSWGLTDYLLSCFGMSVEEYLNDPQPAERITPKMLEHVICEVRNFLRGGLAMKGK